MIGNGRHAVPYAISARFALRDERAEITCYLGAKRWPRVQSQALPVEHRVLDDGDASFAYSSGRPRRLGNAASLVSTLANSSGMPSVSPVANRLGAMASTRMPMLPRSRAIGQAHARDGGLGRGVGDLPDLALERGDRRGVDDDAALLGLVVDRILLAHLPRRPAG